MHKMHIFRRACKASRALGSEKKEKWHEKDLVEDVGGGKGEG